MYYLKLKDRIEKAIHARPLEIEAYNDLFDLCREYEKIDFTIAHEWNHALRTQAAFALRMAVQQSKFDIAERFNDFLFRSLLFGAAHFFDDYLQAVEWGKPLDKKFYQPRRHYLKRYVDAYQEILDGKLDFLSISMPKRAGKSQLGIDRSKVDVSYMTDEEYAGCMDTVFNSLDYQEVDKSLLTGEKYMYKHLNIGDQVAQIAGIIYPIPIDNYVKIVKGVKFYGRYMDDSYAIHESKEFLEELLQGIMEIAKELGITVNTRKTRICKLSSLWRFLQVQYSLTDTGRVIQKINPKRLTTMRRKMKKLVYILPEKEFDDWFNSWFQNHYRIMSKQQRANMNTLHNQLKEVYRNVHDHTT